MPDRYGVIGHPIAHSKSPVIHRLFATQTAQDIAYDAIDIHPKKLKKGVKRLVKDGVKGFNVTVPFKQDLADMVDGLSDRAKTAGAVNTVTIGDDRTLQGDNTDGVGLVRDLTLNLHFSVKDSRILILGAGGAARGIIPDLLEEEPKDLLVANRTVDRANHLATTFKGIGKVSACSFGELGGREFDLIINATSAGLNGEVPPFPASILNEATLCYDLSYAMTDTPFLAWARENGAAKVHQGWGMLVEQAAEAFFLWRGVRPDTKRVRVHLP